MKRAFLVILLLVVVESAWAIFCITTGVDLTVYYAGLIIASGVLWIPKVLDR